MNAPATYDAARLGLVLNELRLPTIARLWPEFAQRSDKEGWQATRLLGALLEHELAERVKRRIERHRIESHLDQTKTLDSFDFGMVPMVSKAHVMALATGDSWLEKGATSGVWKAKAPWQLRASIRLHHRRCGALFR